MVVVVGVGSRDFWRRGRGEEEKSVSVEGRREAQNPKKRKTKNSKALTSRPSLGPRAVVPHDPCGFVFF